MQLILWWASRLDNQLIQTFVDKIMNRIQKGYFMAVLFWSFVHKINFKRVGFKINLYLGMKI